MAKARKLKTTKTERRTILKAAAKAKDGKLKKAEKGGKQKTSPKTPPEKPGRKKRKSLPSTRSGDIPAWLEKPVTIRKARGPDLKPRKRRSTDMTQAKTEGDDVKDNGDKEAKAVKAEADAKAKAKAEADAKAYADAEAKAKAEARDAGVTWTAWPKYGSTPTEAEAKVRADAEAAAKARAEAAGKPWTAWPKADPKAVEDDYVTVYDASSGQTKQMAKP